ncbi:hypothetical protein ZWY2020_051116 [Hordeum vulgare]|nr:hypothetical protein ZWY2020_051116 [Hordeum vulgare]
MGCPCPSTAKCSSSPATASSSTSTRSPRLMPFPDVILQFERTCMPPQETFRWWRINLCSKKQNYYWMKLLLGPFFGTSMGKQMKSFLKDYSCHQLHPIRRLAAMLQRILQHNCVCGLYFGLKDLLLKVLIWRKRLPRGCSLDYDMDMKAFVLVRNITY